MLLLLELHERFPAYSVFLLWAGRTSIRPRYQTAPRDEFRRAVIAIDDAFDQRRSIVIGDGRLDRVGQLSAAGNPHATATAGVGVECLD
jgi:hypothetical protein